MTKRTTAA